MDQLLTQPVKEKRKVRATKLSSKLKLPFMLNIICFSFSDKNNFCQDQMLNTQNDRCVTKFTKPVPRVVKTKYSVSIMVF